MTALKKIAVAVLPLVILTACETDEQKAAHQRELDASTELLDTCSTDKMMEIRVSTVGWDTTAAICERIRKETDRAPSVRVVRRLSQAVQLLNMKGLSTDEVGDAYQILRIAEARGQLGDDDAILANIELAFKIVTSMDGRVRPKDLNVMLAQMGESATKLNDHGIINFAALISANRQQAGD